MLSYPVVFNSYNVHVSDMFNTVNNRFWTHYNYISHSLIIHSTKTKENHKCDGFGNMIKHLHKLAKLSPLFSPEVRICLRSCIKHSH